MIYRPDFSSDEDEDDFDDDGTYAEFKKKMRDLQNQHMLNRENEQRDSEMVKRKAVYKAILYGKTAEAIYEISCDFDVNCQITNEWTALLYASFMGNPAVVEELVKRGANIQHSMDINGETALMLACNSCNKDKMVERLETVKILVENGADVNQVDRKRKTVLMMAAFNGNLPIVEFLLPLIKNKEAVDNQRWTALFWAIDGNQPEIVSYLIKQGFNCNCTDLRRRTPEEIATNCGFYKILDLLPKKQTQEIPLYCFDGQFEEIFADLHELQRPRFVPDIYRFLHSVRSENLINLVYETGIDLCEFLACTDNDLKSMGIQLPYQRNRILQGLYKLHKKSFHPASIPLVAKDAIYSNIDVSYAILSAVKQLIAMEASLKFITKQLSQENQINAEFIEVTTLMKVTETLSKLNLVVKNLSHKIDLWDGSLKSADLITKKRTNIQWATLTAVVCALPVIILCTFYKFGKSVSR